MLTRKLLIVDDVDFNIDFEKKLIESLMRERKFIIDIDIADSVASALN